MSISVRSFVPIPFHSLSHFRVLVVATLASQGAIRNVGITLDVSVTLLLIISTKPLGLFTDKNRNDCIGGVCASADSKLSQLGLSDVCTCLATASVDTRACFVAARQEKQPSTRLQGHIGGIHRYTGVFRCHAGKHEAASSPITGPKGLNSMICKLLPKANCHLLTKRPIGGFQSL